MTRHTTERSWMMDNLLPIRLTVLEAHFIRGVLNETRDMLDDLKETDMHDDILEAIRILNAVISKAGN